MNKPPIPKPPRVRTRRPETFSVELRDYISLVMSEGVPVGVKRIPSKIPFVDRLEFNKYIKSLVTMGDADQQRLGKAFMQTYICSFDPPDPETGFGAVVLKPRSDGRLAQSLVGAMMELEIEHGLGLAAIQREQEQKAKAVEPGIDPYAHAYMVTHPGKGEGEEAPEQAPTLESVYGLSPPQFTPLTSPSPVPEADARLRPLMLDYRTYRALLGPTMAAAKLRESLLAAGEAPEVIESLVSETIKACKAADER